MADSMKAFMAENAVRYSEVEYVASPRFVEDGKPIPWKIAILDQVTMEDLRKKCRKRVVDLKTRQGSVEYDTDKMNDMLIEKCIVYPNLNDAALQDSYHAIGAVELAKKMLLPGEFTDLLQAISEAHGFETDLSEKVKRVKN